jgi:hypothetical protein
MGAAAMQEANNERQQAVARLPRPLLDEAPRCPRCDSIDTKFCYYNMLQPRCLCKRCRRYWAQGRSLCKNKRSLSQLAGSSSITMDHLARAFSSMTMEQGVHTFVSATGFELPKNQLSLSIDELVSSDMDMEVPPLVFDGASVGGGEGATAAATHQGVQWPVGANEEGASNARG